MSEHLKGDTGLFFSNKSHDEIKKYFSEYSSEEYARSGDISSKTIILNSGTDVFSKFSHSIEPYLRKLGLATKLIDAQIHLTSDFIVAE